MPDLGTDESTGVLVRHRVPAFSARWTIPEAPVPESAWHSRCLTLLEAVLSHFAARSARDLVVYRDIAVRVRRDQPQVGFNPDLCLVEPAPPGAEELSSLRLWEVGHVPPRLAIEVVSPGHPHKDYVEIPDQCAAVGVQELVVFDPKLVGPKAQGGPCLLQLWRRTEKNSFDRVAFGEDPVYSDVLGAYFVASDGGGRLRVSEDAASARLWPTGEEQERRAKDRSQGELERERVAKERERIAKETALARVAELEQEMERRGK